jgi:hypothetical protein
MAGTTDFINGVNTTSLRIMVSLLLAVVYVVVILAGAILGKTLPSEALNTVGLFIFGMMGVDAAVFTAKRFSDVNYAAAKTPTAPSPVNVEAPSQVTVRPAAAPVGAPPVLATIAPPAVPNTSEKGDG